MYALMIAILAAAPTQDVKDHADAILEAQLTNGAIVHARTDAGLLIVPYYGNLAAIGLFQAYAVTEEQKYLDAGVAWTDWYLQHINDDGYVYNHVATPEAIRPTESNDAVDVSCATFLMAANMRRSLTGSWRFVLREQSLLRETYAAMLADAGPNGLTENSGAELTVANAEVYAAFDHAKQLAHILNDYEWNRKIYFARRNLKKHFDQLRQDSGLYAWGRTPQGTLLVAEDDSSRPAGLASVAAVAMGPVKWHAAKKTINELEDRLPDMMAYEPQQLYWWIEAARRANHQSLAQQALDAMSLKLMERDRPADHAAYIRAVTEVKRLSGWDRLCVPMGSTFIPVPKQPVRD